MLCNQFVFSEFEFEMGADIAVIWLVRCCMWLLQQHHLQNPKMDRLLVMVIENFSFKFFRRLSEDNMGWHEFAVLSSLETNLFVQSSWLKMESSQYIICWLNNHHSDSNKGPTDIVMMTRTCINRWEIMPVVLQSHGDMASNDKAMSDQYDMFSVIWWTCSTSFRNCGKFLTDIW
jgi:hypothetical protein